MLLTLASTVVLDTRLDVQDWDCPPAPSSCARPVVVSGFPFPYVYDYHGISAVNNASLIEVLLGIDHFHAVPFLADVGLYGVLLGGGYLLWKRRRSVRRRES